MAVWRGRISAREVKSFGQGREMAEAVEAATVARLKSVAPQFAVPDVVSAAEHYRDVLGFEILGYFGQPPVFSTVRRDAVEIQLGKAEAGAGPQDHSIESHARLDAYVWVSDVDLLYAEFRERGAKIVEPPSVRVYQCYEMVVEDKFGFRLAFAKDLSGAAVREADVVK